MISFNKYKKTIASVCLLAIAASTALAKVSDEWSLDVVKGHMKKMAEWQLENPRHQKSGEWSWVYGAFFSGMAAYGQMDPDGPGFKGIRKVGEERGFAPGPRPFHADDYCPGQGYIELGVFERTPDVYQKIKKTVDNVIEKNPQETLEFGKPGANHRWNWIDALFMGPTVFTKLYSVTGDRKYLDYVDRETKATYDYLYDPEEHLFYRDSRYFKDKTPTGKKMFWGRGNSWAIAAMPIILKDMPKEWPNRSFYEKILVDLAGSVKDAQSKDGSWHPSLHDPKNPDIIDMSSTMFFTYGLMWGINNGLLPENEYLPVVKKAWNAACKCINKDGALGWVQPIADKPFAYKESSTEVYGTGAFLLAASEISKYIVKRDHPKLKAIEVKNDLDMMRLQETVSVPATIANGFNIKNLRVYDVRNGRVIPHQFVDNDGDGKIETLLFQADMGARSTREFWIFDSTTLPAASTENVCYSRYVPERMDDFAWENDLTAYRAYGPVLMQPAPKGEGLVSSGIDVWCKKVRRPILDKFYKSKSYHIDKGEGLDYYKVGTGRGCGGTAAFVDNKPYFAKNWVKATNLANGPIRTIFELEYEPWKAGSKAKVSEKRRVSLDAGSFFMKNESTVTVENKASNMSFGPGLDADPKHDNDGKVLEDKDKNIVCVWGRTNPQNGTIGTAMLTLDKDAKILKEDVNYYLTFPIGKPLVWYTGSVWDKAGYVTTPEAWLKEAQQYEARLKSPLKVTMKKAR